MAIRTSDAEWRGDLKTGKGDIKLGSGAYQGAYSYQSRFEDGTGTNPEELIAAAHAGCFSMALAATLAGAGHTATKIHTSAKVHFGPVPGGGFAISKIELTTEGSVARHRCGDVREERGGGEGELPGVEGAEGGGDHAEREAGFCRLGRRRRAGGVHRVRRDRGAAVSSRRRSAVRSRAAPPHPSPSHKEGKWEGGYFCW